MKFKWAKLHKDECDWLVGSDEYDITPNKSGLPPFLNPDMVIARKRARLWLATQKDTDIIRFSFQRTINMYVEVNLKAGAKNGDKCYWTDEEADTFNNLTQRSARLREAFADKVREEFLKVTEVESKAMWKKIEANCHKWEVANVK